VSDPTQTIMSDFFTREELARELRKSVRTIHRWEAEGCAPPHTTIGGEKLFPRKALLKWLENGGTAQPVRRTRRRRAA
jgi:hypothetical protein